VTFAKVMTVIITGANRGIGLELARQYLKRGDTVYAGVRSPDADDDLGGLASLNGSRLKISKCDVASSSSVRSFAASISDAVDVLINNAGMKPERDNLDDLDLEGATQAFQVNALGVLRVTIALLPMLRRSKHARVANISSGLGSIEGNASGGIYGYRMSKSALNMASRSMACDLRDKGIIVAALSPGWVQTEMGGAGAPILVADSAQGLIGVIDRLTPNESGGFFGFRGERIAW
jgi:NAD(P)-dependent dehydrogenase (short-subunit alcohol dehydrogenase family)